MIFEKITENTVEKDPQVAIERLNKLVDDSKDDEYSTAYYHYLLGWAHMITSKYDLALDYYFKALTYFELINDALYCYKSYNGIASIYQNNNNFELALKYHDMSYTKSYELNDFNINVQAMMGLAAIYSDLENHDMAFRYMEKAIKYLDQITDKSILADTYNDISYIYLGVMNFESAKIYLEKAIETYRAIHKGADKANLIVAISNLGETHLELGNYVEAEQYITQALKVALEKDLYALQMESYIHLSTLYERKGDLKTSLDYHKKYAEILSFVTNENNAVKIKSLSDEILKITESKDEVISHLINIDLKNKTHELENTLETLRFATEIGQALTTSLNIDDVYFTLREYIYSFLNISLFGIGILADDSNSLQYEYFEEQEERIEPFSTILSEERSLAAYCLNHNEDIWIKSVNKEISNFFGPESITRVGSKPQEGSQSIIYCRLISENKCIGVFTIQSYAENYFSASDFEVVKTLAGFIAIAIVNAKKNMRISNEAKTLEHLSYHDALTDLYNRRYFNKVVDELIEKNETLGLIVGDMNGLKFINDTFGHIVGDDYLITFSQIIDSINDQLTFRLSGDEFAMIVLEPYVEQLSDIIQSIHDKCKEVTQFEIPMSISLGAAKLSNQIQNSDDLFSEAETRMYIEKTKFHSNY